MLIENIKHPLLDDFLNRITGYGDTYFNVEASSRLNDFIYYISSLVSDDGNDFAFYPLRQGQNIGKGNQAFGIGYMASGAPVNFPNLLQWSESGVVLGPKTTDSRSRVGIINFSGNIKDNKFQFRNNDTSIFYFLKHNRPVYENTLYRKGEVCPYFWFDDSLDNFGVIAPEFSTSDYRSIGTTYIYDEIFGGDKKGYQIDFSAAETAKYNVFLPPTGQAEYGSGIADVKPPPVSFYEIDNNENKFACINAVIKDNNSYLLRSFFGRDYRVLSGNFAPPYRNIRVVDPKTSEVYIDHFFPRRMVIGAGVGNTSISGHDIDGLDHICAGILILRGDFNHKAKDIAENMAEALGIKIRSSQSQPTTGLIGNILKDNSACTPSVKSINYYDSTKPIEYQTYSDYLDFYNFAAAMTGIQYINFGKWVYVEPNLITGELRSPDVPKVVRLTPEIYAINVLNGVSGLVLPPFGNYYNGGAIGFVSGYRIYDERTTSYFFTRFTEQTISGGSGFYLLNNNGEPTGIKNFPPIRQSYNLEITGYVSGIKNVLGAFVPFESGSNLYSSGYFINNTIDKYPKIKTYPEYINGYVSGLLLENGTFSGFDGIDSSSGYFYGENQFEFLPQKVIDANPVTGFLIGLKSGEYFSGFYQNNPIDGLYSGVFANNDFSNLAETDPIVELYFPTGSGLFSGFTGMYGFDERIGFGYTGFFNPALDVNGEIILDENDNPIIVSFNGSSGFIDLGPGPIMNPGTRIVSVTGIIGFRNYLNFSGEFDEFNDINYPTIEYGYEYSGFFVSPTGFLGSEIDPVTMERKNIGSGVLTGLIGYINTFEYVNLTGFDDESYFPIGGTYSGFFPQSSGFSGLSGPYGTGIMTGLIGSKYILTEYGTFSGFSGFSEFSASFLNEININMNFPAGSGFSGAYYENTGIGVMSGLITTGKSPLLFGDPIHFIPIVFSINYSGNSINFYTGDFVFTGVIPSVTGITYLSGFQFTYAVNSGTMITGNFLTGVPSVLAISYYDATESYINDFDFEARDYVLRLEAYEGEQLESGVRIEINKFISGLKADNIWNKINDGFLMAGPRTHSGILIPLKNGGKTGINYNFTSSDYSRKSGLLGDGSSKYIDTQHNANFETTGSQHIATYITKTGSSISQYYFGAGIQSQTGSSAIYASGSSALFLKSRASGIDSYQYLSPRTGFMCISRYNTGVWVARNDIFETPFIYVENGSQNSNIYLFANNNANLGAGTPESYSDARIAFYSVGTNLDLMSLYRSRITGYLSGIHKYIF